MLGPNKALLPSLWFLFPFRQGGLAPVGQEGLGGSQWPLFSLGLSLCTFIFGVPYPSSPPLACTAGGCHSNQF